MLRTVFPLLFVVLLAPLSDGPGRDAEKPAASAPAARLSGDPNDWSMYNYDVRGARHNRGEKVLGRGNVAKLEEKWRFPAKGSFQFIGAIHATPIVVNG